MKTHNENEQTSETRAARQAGSVGISAGENEAFRGVPNLDIAECLLQRVRSSQDEQWTPRELRVLGALGMELSLAAEAPPNRYSIRKMSVLFRTLRRHPDFDADKVRGAAVADVGCGALNPLGCVFVPLLLGARSGLAFDLEEPDAIGPAVRSLYNCAAAMLADPRIVVDDFPVTREDVARNLATFDLLRMSEGDAGGIDRERLDFRTTYDDLADGCFDIVFSNALFEHIGDLDEMLAGMARVTAPGGIGTHIVDGTDHRHYANPEIHPLEFLRVDSDDPIVFGSNRVRPLDLPPLFERHGFEVLRVAETRTVPVPDELRKSFARPFRDMAPERLGAVGVVLHVRKR